MAYSIVIATMNSAKTLEKTLASIFVQSFPKWEIIIQDGGSTDGTLEILKKYSKRVKWQSEPDTGIYDAWNKACARINGKWALFLGADDCLLHKHTLIQCHKHLITIPENILFAYGVLVLGSGGKVETVLNRSLREAYHFFLNNMGLPFPSTFIRTSLLHDDPFDSSYVIAGDYDFAARHATHDNIARIPVWVAYMERGGISDNPCDRRLLNERLRVLRTVVAPKASEFVIGLANNVLSENFRLEDLPKD